jgi:hypothetical protein
LDDPDERDENGQPIKRKFKVSFRPSEPLKLKPEAVQRHEEIRRRAEEAAKEIEQSRKT